MFILRPLSVFWPLNWELLSWACLTLFLDYCSFVQMFNNVALCCLKPDDNVPVPYSVHHHSSVCCSLLLFSPSLFVLKGGLLSLKAVICRKKLPGNNMEGCESHCLLSTPSPHVPTTPFSFSLFLMEWHGRHSGGSSDSSSLMNLDNRYRTNWEEERIWREIKKEGGG